MRWSADMLRAGRSIRFTAAEAAELAELGIDVSSVKSGNGFAMALEPWLDGLAQARPDLFDKITREILTSKGVRPPHMAPRIRGDRDIDSSGQ
jgi:hypothetical protein